MRAFIPATVPMLASWHAAGSVSASTAFAVTPALRERYASGDTEELEYVALTHAARASLELLAEGGESPPCRVVVAADVPDAVPDATAGHSVVKVGGAIPVTAVASVPADHADARAVIAAAVDALGVEGTEAQYAVEDAEATELLWFATQEIPSLIESSRT
jgi:hypothetical protein